MRPRASTPISSIPSPRRIRFSDPPWARRDKAEWFALWHFGAREGRARSVILPMRVVRVIVADQQKQRLACG